MYTHILLRWCDGVTNGAIINQTCSAGSCLKKIEGRYCVPCHAPLGCQVTVSYLRVNASTLSYSDIMGLYLDISISTGSVHLMQEGLIRGSRQGCCLPPFLIDKHQELSPGLLTLTAWEKNLYFCCHLFGICLAGEDGEARFRVHPKRKQER